MRRKDEEAAHWVVGRTVGTAMPRPLRAEQLAAAQLRYTSTEGLEMLAGEGAGRQEGEG